MTMLNAGVRAYIKALRRARELLGNAHRGIRIGTAQLNHELQEDPTMTAVHLVLPRLLGPAD